MSALRLATCAITELGFVRIASGNSKLAEDVMAARAILSELKATHRLEIIDDHLDAERLPPWVKKSEQTTDGHLMALAMDHDAGLATFDRGIPCATVIDDGSRSGWSVREDSVRAA